MSAVMKCRIPRKGLSTGEQKIAFEVDNVIGASCTNLTAAFENALTRVPVEHSLKAEFHQSEDRHEFLNEGGG